MVKCFVSLGTGNPGVKLVNDGALGLLLKTMVEIAIETEENGRIFYVTGQRTI